MRCTWMPLVTALVFLDSAHHCAFNLLCDLTEGAHVCEMHVPDSFSAITAQWSSWDGWLCVCWDSTSTIGLTFLMVNVHYLFPIGIA